MDDGLPDVRGISRSDTSHNVPQLGVPSIQDNAAKRVGMCGYTTTIDQRHNGVVVPREHVVQRDAQLTASLQITGLEQFVEHGVIAGVQSG